MIRLVIKNKDEYSNYVLEDNNNKKYEVNINFIDVELPTIGDYLYISEKVLNEKVSLNYGLIDKSDNVDEEDLILMIRNNHKIYLQRFYG